MHELSGSTARARQRMNALARECLADAPILLELFLSPATQRDMKPVLLEAAAKLEIQAGRLSTAFEEFDSVNVYLLQAIKQWRRQLRESPGESTGKSKAELKPERNRRFYEMAVNAGLEMPKNEHGALPYGIGKLAKVAGVTRQTFASGIKAHIAETAKAQRLKNG